MAMLVAEFIGTAILMIFGNGAVANVELKNTKGVIGQKGLRTIFRHFVQS